MSMWIVVCPGVSFTGREVVITHEAEAMTDTDLITAVRTALRHNSKMPDALWIEGGEMSLTEYLGLCQDYSAQVATKQAKRRLCYARRKEFQSNRPSIALQLFNAGHLYSCANCGAIEDLTIDHIIPLSMGGTDDLVNLRFLCRSCNSKKGIT